MLFPYSNLNGYIPVTFVGKFKNPCMFITSIRMYGGKGGGVFLFFDPFLKGLLIKETAWFVQMRFIGHECEKIFDMGFHLFSLDYRYVHPNLPSHSTIKVQIRV